MSVDVSFDMISVIVPDPNTSWWILTSAPEAIAVNLNGINTLFSNSLSTFFINSRLIFINCPRSLPRNPPECMILDSWVFDNVLSFDDLTEKSLQWLATCLLANKKLCGKLFLSVPIMSADNLRVTPVVIFVADFNLYKWKSDSLKVH